MKKYLLLAIVLTFFSLPVAFAVDANTTSIMDTPTAEIDRRTPISIEHEGNDGLGARLATRLKETFNASNLFKLEEKDVPKFRLLISSVSEFPTRPEVGSAYTVVWVFSQSEATLRHYISREVGVLTAEDLEAQVAKLIERTDGFAVRYSYLFSN